jgi:DNA polymerase-3 subunit epsilon
VDLSERDLHGALLDSRLLAEVYLELKGGKQLSMNLAKNFQENNKTNNNKTSNPKNITKFTPLKEDVELHRVMVSEIKQPVWKKYNY